MAKARQAGSIQRTGKDAFRVRVFGGYDHAGKRRYVSQKVTGTLKDAREVLAVMLTQRDKGEAIQAPRRKGAPLTLNAFLDEWLAGRKADRKIRNRTYHGYVAALKRVRAVLGEKPLGSITPNDVVAMMRARTAKGRMARTVRNERTALRAALESAVDQGLIPTNPTRGAIVRAALPDLGERTGGTIPRDSEPAFRRAVEGERLAAYFLTLLYGGFRPSEALALRWSDFRGGTLYVERVLVDYTPEDLHFAPPKTKKSRRAVPMPIQAISALNEHRKCQAEERLRAGAAWKDHGLIFCTELGEPLRQDATRPVFCAILKRAELPTTLRLYDMRHTHATWLLEDGIAITVVSARLGHSTIQLTVDTYGHLTAPMQDAAVNALNRRAG